MPSQLRRARPQENTTDESIHSFVEPGSEAQAFETPPWKPLASDK